MAAAARRPVPFSVLDCSVEIHKDAAAPRSQGWTPIRCAIKDDLRMRGARAGGCGRHHPLRAPRRGHGRRPDHLPGHPHQRRPSPEDQRGGRRGLPLPGRGGLAAPRRLELLFHKSLHYYEYYLVYDDLAASLSLIKGLPDHTSASGVLVVTAGNSDGGGGYDLLLMKRDWQLWRCAPYDVFRCRPCTPATTASHHDSFGPWRVKACRFLESFTSHPAGGALLGNMALSFQGTAFWPDTYHGVVYCDLQRAIGSDSSPGLGVRRHAGTAAGRAVGNDSDRGPGRAHHLVRRHRPLQRRMRGGRGNHVDSGSGAAEVDEAGGKFGGMESFGEAGLPENACFVCPVLVVADGAFFFFMFVASPPEHRVYCFDVPRERLARDCLQLQSC